MLSEKPWRADKVMAFGLALFACLCLGIVTAGALHQAGVKGFKDEGDFGIVVVGTLSFQGLGWLLIFIFLRQHHIACLDAFGFRGPARGRALLLAVAVVIAIVPITRLLQYASVIALKALNWEPSTQTAVTLLENSRSPWVTAYLGIFAIVAAPVAEEFIFRGVLYPFVKRLGFPRLAWWGVSFLFALIHFDAATFVPLFALALVLTWLYERTDNLLAPVAAHSLFNAANFALFFLTDSLERSPVQK